VRTRVWQRLGRRSGGDGARRITRGDHRTGDRAPAQESVAFGDPVDHFVDCRDWRTFAAPVQRRLVNPYPAVVARVAELLRGDPLRGTIWLVADATGVGRPAVDLLRQAGLRPVPVTIHGGAQVTSDPVPAYLNVPKRELVSSARVQLQASG
jgi:hypothetical protein